MRKVSKLFVTLVLAVALVLGLAACKKETSYSFEPVSKDDFKIGVICLHGEESTYDKNFIDAIKAVISERYPGEVDKHLEIKTGVPESSDCLAAANELAKTCNVVFADSFGHEDYMMQAAAQNPKVRFCHATGTKAHTSYLANYSNAFASIYQGRYLAGYAAGLKLKAMNAQNNCKIGYVGAFPYAEVVSGYTSFYLGVKAGFDGDVQMVVRYTSSWYNYEAEYEAAKALVELDNCIMLSQHADSMGVPTLCKEKNIPNTTYNISTQTDTPDTYVSYSRINWAPYFNYIIDCTLVGIRIDADWTGTLANGAVEFGVTTNTNVLSTVDKLKVDAEALLVAAGKQVFSTANYKVGGNTVTTYQADVNDWGDFAGETEVIMGGVFMESFYRSAPYFDLRIDGITEVSVAQN